MRHTLLFISLCWGCAPQPPQDDCSRDQDCGAGQICTVGICVAAPDAAPELCVAETCDGLDNDCDGTADEGFALGTPCEVGMGLCAREASIVCGPDGLGVCSAPTVEPQIEVCNGLDDDCDGIVDNQLEQPPCTREGCGVPMVEVCIQGQRRCVVAAPEAGDPCDGVDSDCDGTIDEGCECTDLEERPCGSAEGRCTPGVQRCADGVWPSACAGQVGPADERCSGDDEDCDGSTDEGFEVGMPCTAGIGRCAAVGVFVCRADGSAVCDAVAIAPADEVCDGAGADEDCDGRVDEGVLNACGGCGPLPVETCNGQDDDCDGTVDETCGCTDGDRQACRQGAQAPCVAGEQLCENGVWGACSGLGPSPETCNNVDDNCNGEVDEGVRNACGGCGDVPVEVCNLLDDDCDGQTDEGTRNACGQCGAPPAEVCNGQDDDCDGHTDEAVTNACGDCGAPPADTTCDGVDDDCDGRFDEAYAGVACTAGLGMCAREGRVRCANAETRCDATPGPAGTESCDGADEDCDGQVDEQVPAELCEVGVGACTQAGPRLCEEGVMVCTASAGGPVAETCNAIDDDCDGTTDEAFHPTRCMTGVGACAVEVDSACIGGQVVCEGETGASSPEVCNDVDDDCDSATDEETGGAQCIGGLGVCAREGEQRCVGGELVCAAELGEPLDSACNDRDDDCDGEVDESAGLCAGLDNPQGHGMGICTAGACEVGCAPGWYLPSPSPIVCARGMDPPLEADSTVILARADSQPMATLVMGDALAVLRGGPSLVLSIDGQVLPLNEGRVAAWESPALIGSGTDIMIAARGIGANREQVFVAAARRNGDQWSVSDLRAMSGSVHGAAALNWSLQGLMSRVFYAGTLNNQRGIMMGGVGRESADGEVVVDGGAVMLNPMPIRSDPLGLGALNRGGVSTQVFLVGLPAVQADRGGEELPPALGAVMNLDAPVRSSLLPAKAISVYQDLSRLVFATIDSNDRLNWGQVAVSGGSLVFSHLHTQPPEAEATLTVSVGYGLGGPIILSTQEVAGNHYCQARFLNPATLNVEVVTGSMAGEDCRQMQFPDEFGLGFQEDGAGAVVFQTTAGGLRWVPSLTYR